MARGQKVTPTQQQRRLPAPTAEREQHLLQRPPQTRRRPSREIAKSQRYGPGVESESHEQGADRVPLPSPAGVGQALDRKVRPCALKIPNKLLPLLL